MKKIFVALTVVLIIISCRIRYVKVSNKGVFHIASVNNNVCKKLKGNVVLYAIFVDSKYTGVWTEYDIESTLDSAQKAIDWIESQAKKEGISLNIKLDYHKTPKNVIPIEGKMQKRTLTETLFPSTGVVYGMKYLDRWADKIAKEALKSYGPDTSRITKTKIKPKDREKLLARLRDIYKTDNVALVYFINNFYKREMSVALHTQSSETPEYAVVSFKSPGVIAHEFMHLFGAHDLYMSPFDRKRKARKKKEFAMKEFPNEIMAFPYRRINTLNISPFTKYLIGWENELDNKYKEMLIGKKIKIARY
ncbi:MAG TPA: hypothetical protein DIU39_10190 [Flavobacteriales bacterium]|nr:hypothetical protein [Flavobacteriales bacterium]|tara:strand:+ start:166606 stop:167523 length:918 start_codon:yes stop_codon:yes gene_type:complete